MANTKIVLDVQSDLILTNPTITLQSGQNLNVALSAETSSRIAGDQTLTSNLSTETSRATSAELSLNTKVSTETSRAESAELVLTNNLSAEISNRIADVNAEESARIAGDTDLQNQINFIKSNVDPAALDSLTEIVTAFTDADGNFFEDCIYIVN